MRGEQRCTVSTELIVWHITYIAHYMGAQRSALMPEDMCVTMWRHGRDLLL